MGTRKVPFSRELYIEADDFMEDAPKKFFRLAPGREVRLRYAYFITCTEVVKDAAGNITELRCTYDPATRGGNAPDGRKVKGTIHWVSAAHAVTAEVRLYDHLFKTEFPDDAPEGRTFLDNINPDSLAVVRDAKLEPSLAAAQARPAFPIRAAGLLLHRSRRLATWPTSLQSHGHASRYVGQRGGERVKQNDGIALPASAEMLRAHYNAAATTIRTAA